jgi:hypothetical protein
MHWLILDTETSGIDPPIFGIWGVAIFQTQRQQNSESCRITYGTTSARAVSGVAIK